jgi:hypothetical protein
VKFCLDVVPLVAKIHCGNQAWRLSRSDLTTRVRRSVCGSDRGGERAAVMYTLIQTAKLNDIDPQAWLAMSGVFAPHSTPASDPPI